MIKNLLFDLGGVIMDIERQRCVDAFKALGMPHPEDFLGDFAQKGPFMLIEQGLIDPAGFRRVIRESIPSGERVSDASIDAAFCRFLIGIPPHRLAMLRRLRRHYGVFLLSNTNPIMWRSKIAWQFRKEGLARADYFDGMVTSFEAKSMKPDAGIFRYALQKFGIAAADTVFFDDSRANIAAAEALGFTGCYVAPGSEVCDTLEGYLSRGGEPLPPIHRVATVGNFDGVHRGHMAVIERLKRLADVYRCDPMVVTFQSHPLELVAPERAPMLLMSPEERVERLEAQGLSVLALPFDESLRSLTATEFMVHLRDNYAVDTLLIGYDNRIGRGRALDFKELRRAGREIGVNVLRVGELKGTEKISSSAIRRMIAEGEVDRAAEALGYTYSIEGTIAGGKRLGHRLGFPTANVVGVHRRKLLPARGVYAARAYIDGSTEPREAVVNIGCRPTVDGADAPVTIEVHVMDFDGDIYGSRMRVEFVKRLRPERRFADTDALRHQIGRDVADARRILGRC